ncbi:MAG: UPF0158 family protein [Polyangiaceae bacterium]
MTDFPYATDMSVNEESPPPAAPSGQFRDIPVDWEALEDAFENNAPEVHSYLHLSTGDVLRVVDGVADPQMHTRINADASYLRIAPVSSREQYRWMERFIPMVEEHDLRGKLAASIDGKGAFRRFKDVLMSHGVERERWFAFRSERLRTFMEAWLTAHAMRPIPRPHWPSTPPPAPSASERIDEPPPSVAEPRETRDNRRGRNAEALRKQLRELIESLGPRDLETMTSFAEFLRQRRANRGLPVLEGTDPVTIGDEGPVSSERAGATVSTIEAEIRPTGSTGTP